ncbi:MAG: hypothetical protein JSW11_00885 [Candidatus Heimdallarchaeota archaeon]|nr:MAG: hypothetical protein JSW11_00885 [Candidatus Heimdallarchaeota archaeon]
MNIIAKKIINNQLLSLEEAEKVYDDLTTLESTGVWEKPDWAIDLSRIYHVGPATHEVISAGWKALAKAFRSKIVVRRSK